MTVAKFRRWLQQKIDYLQAFPDECRWQDDHIDIQGFLEEAYQYAVDLRLPEAAAACKKGPAIRRLMECLNAIPASKTVLTPSDSLSVKQAAQQLGVSQETVYRLCAEGTLAHERHKRRITITPAQLAEYRREQRV